MTDENGDSVAANPEKRLAGFFKQYPPAIAKLGKALRAKLRDRLPGLSELVYVYENQKALVISYSPTEAGADGVCGIALYPSRVNLFMAGGAQLSKADPKKLLQGRGKSARAVEMKSVADFDRPEIEALISAAVKIAKVRLDAHAEGPMIIKAEDQKRRAERAKKAAPGGAARIARTSQ